MRIDCIMTGPYDHAFAAMQSIHFAVYAQRYITCCNVDTVGNPSVGIVRNIVREEKFHGVRQML
jgi:hypothetical protein